MISCSQCDKTFSRRYDLKRHEEGVHNRHGHIQCDRCQCTFSRYDNLMRHQLVCRMRSSTQDHEENNEGVNDHPSLPQSSSLQHNEGLDGMNQHPTITEQMSPGYSETETDHQPVKTRKGTREERRKRMQALTRKLFKSKTVSEKPTSDWRHVLDSRCTWKPIDATFYKRMKKETKLLKKEKKNKNKKTRVAKTIRRGILV